MRFPMPLAKTVSWSDMQNPPYFTHRHAQTKGRDNKEEV